jgi:hypothetical protein
VTTNIGNGITTFLLKDKWIHGCSIEDIAFLITAAVPEKCRGLFSRPLPHIIGYKISMEIFPLLVLSNIYSCGKFLKIFSYKIQMTSMCGDLAVMVCLAPNSLTKLSSLELNLLSLGKESGRAGRALSIRYLYGLL